MSEEGRQADLRRAAEARQRRGDAHRKLSAEIPARGWRRASTFLLRGGVTTTEDGRVVPNPVKMTRRVRKAIARMRRHEIARFGKVKSTFLQ